ncbi:MAG TPA: TerB family tellurite resistance protein [Thermoanaerobaculia bacterium]|nr:TerB family tellurite resistance protein [Thermoanaerobaculia bacterium]
MSLLRKLGFGGGEGAADEAAGAGDTETVRKIVARLEALPPERARYVAAFAYVLSRVAHADLAITADETRRMEEIVRTRGHLPDDQAVLVVEIAKAQSRLFGGTENFLVTRELAGLATAEQKRELLDCLFSVAAADGGISGAEEAQVRQVASELGFDHAEFVAARRAWREHREVLRGLPGRREG